MQNNSPNELWKSLRNIDDKTLLNKVEVDMEKISQDNHLSLAEDKKHLRHKFFYTIHAITKYSCIWAAILIWIIVTFFLGLMCWMVFLRVKEIVTNQVLLAQTLSSVWAALSGALVLACAQLAIILVKKNTSDEP